MEDYRKYLDPKTLNKIAGLDLLSGAVTREINPGHLYTGGHHVRCYRGKATDNYLLMSRTGIEFLDVRKKSWDVNHWVRGACLYGILPANGLVYAPQHPCACYIESKQYGLSALAPAAATPLPRAKTSSPATIIGLRPK